MEAKRTGDLKASFEVLLGATDLDDSGCKEFTEWDLTVATWKRNPNRFGCRGYEDKYPDHKRVMMELMGKDNDLIRNGWLRKVRTNTYKLSDLGRSEANKLKFRGTIEGVTRRSPQAIYDAVAPFHKSNVFRKHVKDPDEPRLWLGAASFYQLSSPEPQHLVDRLSYTNAAIANAMDWLEENDVAIIRRGVSGSGQAISRTDVENLQKFDRFLRERFAAHIDAITSRLKK